MPRKIAALAASMLILTGCGDTKEERVTTGAVIGAGAGTAAGFAVGAPFIGAALGTGTGMLIGGWTAVDW